MLLAITSTEELRYDPQGALIDAITALFHWIAHEPVNLGNREIDFDAAEMQARNHLKSET